MAMAKMMMMLFGNGGHLLQNLGSPELIITIRDLMMIMVISCDDQDHDHANDDGDDGGDD